MTTRLGADNNSKTSTFALLGLPTEFGTLLLTLALVFTLTPYLSGADLGLFKIPVLEPSARALLRIVGPLGLLFMASLFVPVWRPRDGSRSQASAPPQRTGPRKVAGGLRAMANDVQSVPKVTGPLFDYWSRRPAVEPEIRAMCTTVAAELALNALEHGSASYVDIACYRRLFALEDDGSPFDPLAHPPELTPGGGLGLVALDQLVAQTSAVTVAYRSYHGCFFMSYERPVHNQLLAFIAAPAGTTTTEPFRLRLRSPVESWMLARPWQLPHIMDLEWGHATYLLDIEQLYDEVLAPTVRVLSAENSLIHDLLSLLPPSSTIQLRIGRNSLMRKIYQSAEKQYQGRVVLLT